MVIKLPKMWEKESMFQNRRNRRYYRITDNGKNKLEMYRNEWISYTEKINSLLKGGDNNE